MPLARRLHCESCHPSVRPHDRLCHEPRGASAVGDRGGAVHRRLGHVPALCIVAYVTSPRSLHRRCQRRTERRSAVRLGADKLRPKPDRRAGGTRKAQRREASWCKPEPRGAGGGGISEAGEARVMLRPERGGRLLSRAADASWQGRGGGILHGILVLYPSSARQAPQYIGPA